MKEMYSIYKTIKEAINNKLPYYYHIAMWNNNTERLEQEVGFHLPAIFIEVEPLSWEQRGGKIKTARAVIKLHFINNAITEELEDSYDKCFYRYYLTSNCI